VPALAGNVAIHPYIMMMTAWCTVSSHPAMRVTGRQPPRPRAAGTDGAHL